MGEGSGSWFPLQQFDMQSPNLNSLADPLTSGQQSIIPHFINSGTNMVSTTGTLPVYAHPELPHLRVGQANEPSGRFYCLPRFRQVLAPAPNSFLKKQLPASPCENGNNIPKVGSGCAQKRFLVFDQSGYQNTLVFSSALGTSIKCSSWGPKSPAACNFNGEDPIAKVNLNLHSGPISKDVFIDSGTVMQSEMHEDTEELNALLYSDDDSDYNEDEVTSTGHSPSTMTAHYEQFEGGAEEVACSTGLIKKRKLLDYYNDYVPLLTENTSSLNPNRCSEYGDDADSSSAIGQNPGTSGIDSSSGNKRIKRDKIWETVNVLRSIIPGGEGKDAIVVLDEAIDYLKSLKLKAQTLGLS